MSDILLTTKGISKDFAGLRALNSVDLSVKRGTITALIGPNGSGKTTLINIISGMYDPSNGSVFFEEKCIDGFLPHKIAEMGISRTFQLTKLFGRMSVLENVMVGAQTWARKSNFLRTVLNLESVRREETKIHDFAMEMLKLIHIEKLADERAGNLPHGQQRLVELARALVTKPKLILLDEPAAGLNLHEEDILQTTLRSIVHDGITILIVEHHMRLVMRISDWVYVLNVGHKIASGTPGEIGKNPTVVKAYLGKEY
jgi:branched-chain amino acid transport system ATP-binding protein